MLTFLGVRRWDPCDDRIEAEEASSVMMGAWVGVLRESEWVRRGEGARGHVGTERWRRNGEHEHGSTQLLAGLASYIVHHFGAYLEHSSLSMRRTGPRCWDVLRRRLSYTRHAVAVCTIFWLLAR